MEKKFLFVGLIAIIFVVFTATIYFDVFSMFEDTEIIPGNSDVAGFVEYNELDDSQSTQQGLENLVSGNNRFAFNLYNILERSNKSENIFFSPFSLHTALGMTYEGANGITAEEMENVLMYPNDDLERRGSFAKLFNELYNNSIGNYQLNIANAIWSEETFPFKQSFFDVINSYYYGKTDTVDFLNNPEEQRLLINSWVENQTNNKIKDLLAPKIINSDTKMVLVNAIYFKGDWKNKFDVENTKKEEFRINENDRVNVDMMHLNEEFNYFEKDGIKYLELPYKGENLSMFIILPEEFDFDLPSYDEIVEAQSNMRKSEVDVKLPKFKFEEKYELNDILKYMGIKTAFIGSADFSNMYDAEAFDSNNILYISKVVQKAFIEVNEEGSEAAAATAVIIQKQNAMMPNYFVADQPFAFFIQDLETKEILFMGKIVNPANTA